MDFRPEYSEELLFESHFHSQAETNLFESQTLWSEKSPGRPKTGSSSSKARCLFQACLFQTFHQPPTASDSKTEPSPYFHADSPLITPQKYPDTNSSLCSKSSALPTSALPTQHNCHSNLGSSSLDFQQILSRPSEPSEQS